MSEQRDGAGMTVQGDQNSGNSESHGQDEDFTMSRVGRSGYLGACSEGFEDRLADVDREFES